MASFFGEIKHPGTRAFWAGDDDDILDSNIENVKFTINWLEPIPSQIEKLIIVESEKIIDFVTRLLSDNAKIVCSIDNNTNDKNSTKVYLDGDIYICTINSKLDLAHAGELTETIKPLLTTSKNIFTLTSDHISHFKSEEEINSPSFLKSLYSCQARKNKKLKIPSLNQPNFVSGVCAGVLSYAEIANLHCIMYILYTDTFTLDSKNSLPLTELFSEILGKTVSNVVTGGSSFFNKGNLYL